VAHEDYHALLLDKENDSMLRICKKGENDVQTITKIKNIYLKYDYICRHLKQRKRWHN
jgi:hypothetical protein